MTHDVEFRDKKPTKILVVEDDAPDMALISQQIKTLWPDCDIVPVGFMYSAYKAFKT
jgi:hypothetical protein